MLLRLMGGLFSSLALLELGERAVTFFWLGADDFVNEMILGLTNGLTQASMSQVLFAFAPSDRRRAPSRRNSGQWLRRTVPLCTLLGLLGASMPKATKAMTSSSPVAALVGARIVEYHLLPSRLPGPDAYLLG